MTCSVPVRANAHCMQPSTERHTQLLMPLSLSLSRTLTHTFSLTHTHTLFLTFFYLSVCQRLASHIIE